MDSDHQTRVSCTLSLQTCHRINTILERNNQILAATIYHCITTTTTCQFRGVKNVANPHLKFTILATIYFSCYTWTRLKLSRLTGTPPDELGIPYLCLAGGITGVATWCWYPVDVIKSRFQNDGTAGAERTYRGVICIVATVSHNDL